MSLEERILQIVKEEVEGGKADEVIRAKFKEAMESAFDDVFKSYGPVVKKMKEEIESVIIPAVEHMDYSRYVVKLDHILTNIVKEAATPHRRIVENFAELSKYDRAPDTLNVSELFEKYKEYASSDVDVDGLEISYDDGEPRYYDIEVSMDVEELDTPSWSNRREYNVIFTCEEDEELNKMVRIEQVHDGKHWVRGAAKGESLSSLRYLDKFDVFVMMVAQGLTNVKLDTRYDSEHIEVEEKPEPTWG